MRRVLTTGVWLYAIAAMAQTADVLSLLGISPQAAKTAVEAVLTSGVYNPGLPAGAFRVMLPAARAEAATAGVQWLKAYTASAEFTQQYAQMRGVGKPAPPEFPGTPEDELRTADEEQARQVEESNKAIASLPPAQRAQVEESMKAAQAMIAQMNTPEMRKTRLDAVTRSRAERTTQYDQELATWKRDYPESPSPIIARRLRQFLASSADVDFAATLVPRNGKMAFEDPAYEQKPGQWKLCYRAGREATSAARAAVQAWLKEL